MKNKIFIAVLLFSLVSVSSWAEFYLFGGPIIEIDYDKTKESAPTPIVFNFGAGGIFLSEKPLCIDFGLSFFTNYYDCTEEKQVIFTEIENRTVLALSFLADCTARYNRTFGNNRIMVGGGVGFLARFGIKEKSVPASEDWKIDEIKSSFWKGAAFIFPEVAFSWLYKASENIQAGLELKAYIGIQQTMISVTAKVAFNKKKTSPALLSDE